MLASPQPSSGAHGRKLDESLSVSQCSLDTGASSSAAHSPLSPRSIRSSRRNSITSENSDRYLSPPISSPPALESVPFKPSPEDRMSLSQYVIGEDDQTIPRRRKKVSDGVRNDLSLNTRGKQPKKLKMMWNRSDSPLLTAPIDSASDKSAGQDYFGEGKTIQVSVDNSRLLSPDRVQLKALPDARRWSNAEYATLSSSGREPRDRPSAITLRRASKAITCLSYADVHTSLASAKSRGSLDALTAVQRRDSATAAAERLPLLQKIRTFGASFGNISPLSDEEETSPRGKKERSLQRIESISSVHEIIWKEDESPLKVKSTFRLTIPKSSTFAADIRLSPSSGLSTPNIAMAKWSWTQLRRSAMPSPEHEIPPVLKAPLQKPKSFQRPNHARIHPAVVARAGSYCSPGSAIGISQGKSRRKSASSS